MRLPASKPEVEIVLAVAFSGNFRAWRFCARLRPHANEKEARCQEYDRQSDGLEAIHVLIMTPDMVF